MHGLAAESRQRQTRNTFCMGLLCESNTTATMRSASTCTWTSRVPKTMAYIPFMFGIEAIILGTLEVQAVLNSVLDCAGEACMEAN